MEERAKEEFSLAPSIVNRFHSCGGVNFRCNVEYNLDDKSINSGSLTLIIH